MPTRRRDFLPSARSPAANVTASVTALGGRAERQTVIDHAVEHGTFTAEQRCEAPHVRGKKRLRYASELHYRMGWALSHARNAGMLASPERGIWALPGHPSIAGDRGVAIANEET
jgi:restriction endonuclease Mrr